jgi:hypothetical protein
MKKFARSKVGSLFVVALLVLTAQFVPPTTTAANGQGNSKEKTNDRYKPRIVKGEAVVRHAKELRVKNKGVARAMKDMEKKGLRQAFEHSVSVLAVKDEQASKSSSAAIRPAAFQETQSFFNDGYEMTFIPYDDGDPNTWEGVVYEHDPDMMEYSYTATFDVSGAPETWAPTVETYYPADGSVPVSSTDPQYYDPSYQPYEPRRDPRLEENMSKGNSMQSSGEAFFTKAGFAPGGAAYQRSRWRDRLQRWARCVVGGCTAAAIGCLAGGPTWVVCWTAWCGGAEVGCVILSW